MGFFSPIVLRSFSSEHKPSKKDWGGCTCKEIFQLQIKIASTQLNQQYECFNLLQCISMFVVFIVELLVMELSFWRSSRIRC